MSVLSLSDVKTHLNITTSKDDGEIQATIDAAEAAITHLVGPLAPTTITTTVPGASSVTLPVYPVLSLTSVTNSAGVTLPLAGFTVDLTAGVVTGTGAGLGSGQYTVTYSAGRDPLPADLKLAVKELVRHLWGTQRNPAVGPLGAISDGPATTPGVGYLLPYRVQELLAPHMQFGFA